MKYHPLIISIDLDMWWHCRWATGSTKSIWPNTESLFKEYYGKNVPGGELNEYTANVLDLLDKFEIKATFFILGEVAGYFPDLIKKISARGHEIACHGYYHIDATELGRETFHQQVYDAKNMLEDLCGVEVRGFRAPNLILSPWIFDELLTLGFQYDSSICPSRSFFGKFKDHEGTPNIPYILDKSLHPEQMDKSLLEIPIPVMPYLRLSAGSGIMTRVLGCEWSLVALRACLHKGPTMYYFHPYEIGESPKLPQESRYIRLFLRNIGEPYKKMLHKILRLGKRNGSQTAWQIAKRIYKKQN